MNRSEPGDLMSCPFCGGEAVRETLDGSDGVNNCGGDVIYCKSCHASSAVEFGRKENLVSKWNSRHMNLTKYAPHQLRLIDEKQELDEKREKLGEFKNSRMFASLPWQEQERLNTQAHIMTMYSAVLGARIAAFGDQS